jgi:hypothetical protein
VVPTEQELAYHFEEMWLHLQPTMVSVEHRWKRPDRYCTIDIAIDLKKVGPLAHLVADIATYR